MIKFIDCKIIIAKISSNFDSLHSSKAKRKQTAQFHVCLYQQNNHQNQFKFLLLRCNEIPQFLKSKVTETICHDTLTE